MTPAEYACLPWSPTGELAQLIAFGMTRCLARLGALPQKLVWDREGAIHAGGGRPSEEFAAFCGQLALGWVILDAGDCQAKAHCAAASCTATSRPVGASPTSSFVTRVAPQPCLRFDRNDYSLDPRLVGRRERLVTSPPS